MCIGNHSCLTLFGSEVVADEMVSECFMKYIKHGRPCLTTFPNTEKRVENMTQSGVFLMNFEVFGNMVKHCLECLIYLLN